MAGKYANILSTTAGHFKRIANIKKFTQPDGGVYTRLPGFKYDDFNRAGLLNIVQLKRLAEMVHLPTIFPENGLVFVVCAGHLKFTPALFDRAAVEFPMIIRTGVLGVGRSSLDLCLTVEDEADDTLLASCAFRLVNIDPNVRRGGIPIPETFRQATLLKVTPRAETFPKVAVTPVVPKDAFSCRIRVRYVDMDRLFHSNNSSYLGFVQECSAQAVAVGYYAQIREDIAFYRPLSVTSMYLAQSRAGDELDVSTWEDTENKMLLNFVVSKQGNIIHSAHLEYNKL